MKSSMDAADMGKGMAALKGNNEEVREGPGGKIDGFNGPLSDDVPGLGDIANVHASSLGNCASRCLGHAECRSFEYSLTAGMFEAVRNCQLAKGNTPSGLANKDFKLYIRQESLTTAAPLEGSLKAFHGPLADDVPGYGDLGNVQVESLDMCASKCMAQPMCKTVAGAAIVEAVASIISLC